MTLDVTMKGTSASGIISCLVLWTGVTGTDEIDLESVFTSFDLLLWSDLQ